MSIKSALVLTGCLLSAFSWGETLNVAVASNFKATLEEIAQRFEQNSEHQLRIASASTGVLYSQILHGAHFDLFFAADQKRPELLEQLELILPGSRFSYAQGRIVLLFKSGLLTQTPALADIRKMLVEHEGKLAIANPNIAPYGMAAKQFLQQLGLWQDLQAQLVRGSNINQAYQYIATGSLDLGVVASTQIIIRPVKNLQSWSVPTTMYQAIIQQAVQLKNSKNREAATAFLLYLKSPAAQNIIRSHGYGIANKPVTSALDISKDSSPNNSPDSNKTPAQK